MRIVGPGHASFALASASLAILSFAYGNFAPEQTLPAWIPRQEMWVDGSAILVLFASAGLCFARTALPSALTIGVYLALWAVISSPPILSTPFSVGAWYGLCEALTSLVGVWILYCLLRWPTRGSQMPLAAERTMRVARVLFGLTCVFYGWSHFAYAEYTAGLVPSWLPDRSGFAYFTGLGHLAAGVGIIVGILPRLAATLETLMMSSFGLLVWMPSFSMEPRPPWATPPQNQWSELVVNLVLVAAAWMVATSLRSHPWAQLRTDASQE